MNIKMMLLLCPISLIASQENPNDVFDIIRNHRSHQNSTVLHSMLQNNPRLPITKNARGQTPLMVAIAEEKQSLAEQILRNMDINSINEQDIKGNSALHYAIMHRMPIVLIMINKGANLNIKNWNQETPIHQAACYQASFREIVFGLNQANLSLQDRDGNTALHIASKYGAENIVGYVLHRDPTMINIQNNFKMTALHLAIITKNIPCIQEFLKYKYNAKNEHVPMYKFDTNLQDDQGYTPLHLAVLFHGYTDPRLLRNNAPDPRCFKFLVSELLKRNADTTVTTKYDETAYELAIKFRKGGMIYLLEPYETEETKRNSILKAL